MLKNLGLDRAIKENQAVVKWEEAVGKRIAEVTKVERVRKGKLYVKVNSSSWRNELISLKGNIIDKLNTKIGERVIYDIIFL